MKHPAARALLAATSLAAFGSACTEQIPRAFRLAQQEELFSAETQLDVSTQIDLLWVVDNSASMDVSQQRLREGFDTFARKYMQPTWDIRVAVITTDTYLANPAFSEFLGSVMPYTQGWASPYIASRLATFQNPAANPTLVNPSTGEFDGGVSFRDIWPAAGPQYAQLLAGVHDGPIPAFCFEGHPYFMLSMSDCRVRDRPGANVGVESCLNPAEGEKSTSQCVNTLQNNTVHSGRAVLSTLPPKGVAGDAVWTEQLIRDFRVNVTTGTSGHGSERGLSSLTQLLADNETGAQPFFRQGSLRVIVFVSDEEDQSLEIPASPHAGFNPWSDYLTDCPVKTVDDHSYQLSKCPDPSKLIPVESFKTRLDTFFRNLDLAQADAPANYFVVSIVPLTGAAIQALQAAREPEDTATGNYGNVAVGRGDRYLALGTMVGNGSLSMNIADSNYSPILEEIGRTIIEKKSTFTLKREPLAAEEVLVTIRHADGSETVIPADKYVVSGKSLLITDSSIVLGLQHTDQIIINYEPKTVY